MNPEHEQRIRELIESGEYAGQRRRLAAPHGTRNHLRPGADPPD